MNSVEIKVNRQNAYDDILLKSHIDAAVIVDPAERYMVEAGTEKAEQIHQCISDAFVEASLLLRRYTASLAIYSAETSYDEDNNLEITLTVSDRRSHNLAPILAPLLHAYVVDHALAKYYGNVRPSFSVPYQQRIPTDVANIESIIYTKQPPTVTL